jgi:hypothetical protein
MIKVTEKGVVELGKPKKRTSKQDAMEIMRMFSVFENGMFDYDGVEVDEETTVFAKGVGMEGRCCPRF